MLRLISSFVTPVARLHGCTSHHEPSLLANTLLTIFFKGAQWLSGRVLDSRSNEGPRVRASPTSAVQSRKTRPCLTERLLMGRKDPNQTNKLTKLSLVGSIIPSEGSKIFLQ